MDHIYVFADHKFQPTIFKLMNNSNPFFEIFVDHFLLLVGVVPEEAAVHFVCVVFEAFNKFCPLHLSFL